MSMYVELAWYEHGNCICVSGFLFFSFFSKFYLVILDYKIANTWVLGIRHKWEFLYYHNTTSTNKFWTFKLSVISLVRVNKSLPFWFAFTISDDIFFMSGDHFYVFFEEISVTLFSSDNVVELCKCSKYFVYYNFVWWMMCKYFLPICSVILF